MDDDKRIAILVDWLQRQAEDSSITDGRIWQEMAVSERTFYRLKPKGEAERKKRSEERQKALEQIKTHEVMLAAKKAIETRIERIVRLQAQIKGIEADLEEGVMVDYIMINGSYEKVCKVMNAETKAYLRKAIKEIQAEISKIEGDYAAEKREHTGKDGRDLFSNLTEEQIDARIKQLVTT